MAITSAQTKRFESCAVAGISIPARDRRSPSTLGICTNILSDVMIMDCFGLSLFKLILPSLKIRRIKYTINLQTTFKDLSF
jgi:hypothetical protein